MPAGIQDGDIEKIMSRLLSSPVDAADIYFQSSHFESWVMEGGIIKEGSHNIEQGAGVRAVFGEKTGFAYSDRIELPVLLEAANNVKAIVRQGQDADPSHCKVTTKAADLAEVLRDAKSVKIAGRPAENRFIAPGRQRNAQTGQPD